MPQLIESAVIWLGLALVAALNGALRESLFASRLGPRGAQAVSGLLLSGMIFALTVLWLPHLGPLTAGDCWTIGAFWVALTLIFECLVARFTGQRPIKGLSALAQIRQGNLMLLVLLVTLTAPYLAARLHGLI